MLGISSRGAGCPRSRGQRSAWGHPRGRGRPSPRQLEKQLEHRRPPWAPWARLPETEGHLGRAWLQSTPPGSGAQAAPCQRKASPRRTGTRSSALSAARGCGPNLRARRPRTDAPRSALGAGGGCGFCSAPQGALPRAAPRSRAAPPAPGTDKGVEEGRSGSHSQRGGRGPLGSQGGASRLRPSAGGPAAAWGPAPAPWGATPASSQRYHRRDRSQARVDHSGGAMNTGSWA